ncbi:MULTISPECIES: PQQ-dependent sugar dehydrogenase [unclassified Shinella]|uniref:PQQ-dependent sugar dehydrogenase n=1 Tax=unclassified Shinella TaxID=2643062 RepID=UPI00225D657A|nr:PQQ-dependent sugar dehydrogenase [Shinella sp. YE25]MDC7255812.1 PQQ-dependent sugar dehydrogenase [Shinella sp. YE25]CAI0338639.1 Aldose sugar dehydrogenase YliI [Rhizobiaceae bacterium]CAK7257077.1 Aldose sugar dehydrogenase YliI [Shinella sp. WSC3-e]
MRQDNWPLKGILAGTAATLLLTATLLASPASAAETREIPSKKAALVVETLATGLKQPWSVEVLPDGAYLVSEKGGTLRLVRDGKVSAPLRGVPEVSTTGQGGLLDIALAPDFAGSRTLYLTYSARGNGGSGTAVARARLSADGTALEDTTRIFLMNRLTARGQHFGSRIAIAGDGSLFFGIGDRGQGPRAQDPRDHAGAILHINPDGSPHADNPFLGSAEGLAEIWSKGHRNPQGLTIDPKDGTLLTVEHGARGGDEINAPQPGRNYGWPLVSYGRHYSGAEFDLGSAAEGFEPPLYYWDPSIAPGAIAIYRGAMFPEWEGNLIVTALKYQLVARLERDESGAIVAEERMFGGEFGRIRDVIVAPDGALLLVTDDTNGALLRVSRSTTTD